MSNIFTVAVSGWSHDSKTFRILDGAGEGGGRGTIPETMKLKYRFVLELEKFKRGKVQF